MHAPTYLRRRLTVAALLLGLMAAFAAPGSAAGRPDQDQGLASQIRTPEQMVRYLRAHRAEVALASYTVTPDGGVDTGDPVILHQPDRQLPLASTIKIVILASYAEAVAAGRVDPQQAVTLSAWEATYMPGTDGGAHPSALAWLGLPADDYGFARDGSAEVPLDVVAHMMIAVSDNAAADYLLDLLGPAAFADTVARLGLGGQQPQLPVIGQVLAWSNHETGSLTAARVRALAGLDAAAYGELTHQLATAFLDPNWRLAELEWRLAGGGDVPFHVEALAAAALAPRGTVRDYARIMARVVTGTLESPAVSVVMRRHLEVPTPDDSPLARFGYKGGSFAGILTRAAYVVPRVGQLAGKPHVSVLFLTGLSATTQSGLEASSTDLTTALLLGFDPAFARRVGRVLGR